MAKFAFIQSAHDPAETQKFKDQITEVRAGLRGKLGKVHQEALNDLNSGRTQYTEIREGGYHWTHSQDGKFHHFVHPDIVRALVKTGKAQIVDNELHPTGGKQ